MPPPHKREIVVTDYVSADTPYFMGTPETAPRFDWQGAEALGEVLLLH